MPDSLTLPERDYSLARAAVYAESAPAASSSADALTRQSVEPAAAESSGQVIVKIENGDPPPESFARAAGEVIDLLALPRGWNSYDARPIRKENAERALGVLAEFLQPETQAPTVVPTVKGGIQLEWHTAGVDIEIYVDSPAEVSFFAEELRSNESIEAPLDGHENELRSWLRRVSGR